MEEVVDRVDLCSVPLVGVALHVAATTAARHAPRFQHGMGYAAVAALLIVLAWGVWAVGIFEPRDVLAVAVLAWVSASTAALATLLILPPLFALGTCWRQAVANRRAEVARWRARQAAERPARSPVPPPPVPTKAERAAAARADYLRTVEWLEAAGLDDAELRAAKEKAKQRYLASLDREL